MKKEKGSSSYAELVKWFEEDVRDEEEEIAQDFLKSKVIRKVVSKLVTARLKVILEDSVQNYLDTYLLVNDDGVFLLGNRLSLGSGMVHFKDVCLLSSFFNDFIAGRNGDGVEQFVAHIRQIADDIERRYPAQDCDEGGQ